MFGLGWRREIDILLFVWDLFDLLVIVLLEICLWRGLGVVICKLYLSMIVGLGIVNVYSILFCV